MSPAEAARPGEFEMIARLFAPLAKGVPGAFGLTDDAASVAPRPGEDIVVTMDTLVEGVHFLSGDRADLVARKLLRVNLSDLAGKGARPDLYFLSLALPDTLPWSWLEAFARGLAEDQAQYGLALAGGDTAATPGPLVMTVTALGGVPAGGMVRRGGARAGDYIFVTGTIGDAALGLEVRKGGLDVLSDSDRRALEQRYLVPEPRTLFGQALVGIARAAADVSDGLAADLGHILETSSVGATLDLRRLPLSAGASAALSRGLTSLEALAAGGDDYELVLTAPEEAIAALTRAAGDLKLTEIGRVTADLGLNVLAADGTPATLSRAGYQHF